ncbi:MAG: histidine phosphatase family protein [Fimbriimonadaceae bacterium]|nr:histidine phosphatase family protein [Fimbriimonadaceae bacterium]
MRLYLIRHGQTEWNNQGRAQGHTDVDLDAAGLRQAEGVAEFFRHRCLHRIWTSDLRRCRQTAQPTVDLTRIEPEVYRELRERTFGELEGSHYAVLRAFFDGEARERGICRSQARPPGGESVQDVWNRVEPLVQRLKGLEGDTVIFSHGGTTSIILAQLIQAPVVSSMSFRLGNACISELKRLPSGIWLLQHYDDGCHLEPCHDQAE